MNMQIKVVKINVFYGLFYNIGNCAQSVRNFACFKKVNLFAPKSGGRCLPVASGYRRPEQSGDRGLSVIKSLFYNENYSIGYHITMQANIY